MENKTNKLTETPYIKIIKNTKGYNWEIKIIGVSESHIHELKQIDTKLREQFVEKEVK